jgi:Zn-finger nucleic acid-binding protein
MKCPKCHSNFEMVSTAFGEIERCVSCKGLWLDMLEDQTLKGIADEIDVGDPEVGKKFNAVDRIKCPECPSTSLLRMVDPKQPHIWFESCPRCYGRFYDAGELKDLSEQTLSDFVKRFNLKERK